MSDITAKEAELVYGKSVDVIIYNGFDYPKSEEELDLQFRDSRNTINTFLDTLSKDSYALNLPNTYIGYISGRYEIHNKGVDVLIQALSKVNQKLKEENSNKTFVVWFMLMFGDSKYNQRFTDIKNNSTQKNHNDMLQTPHELGFDNDVLKLFSESNLNNLEEDRIKVLLTPNNFTKGNDLIGLDYYELITGMDIGILPSYYEPWGYTPAESIACSTPCYTTDLSGIGRFEELRNCSTALKVIPREGVEDEEFVDKLAAELYHTINSSQKEQYELRIQAQKCAKLVSWERFYIRYLDAYDYSRKLKNL